MFMKGKFDTNVLLPLAKSLQNLVVDWSTAPNFTVIDLWSMMLALFAIV